jgi:N-acetylmuramoyl-L-alanine amidase
MNTPALAFSKTADLVDPETLVSVPQLMDLQALALPVRRVVIDPGHGGDDPGAVTSQGLTEKELALDIGLRLRDLLVTASFDVRMTREDDKTVPLVQRVVFANREEGDLFLSIHVNWVEPRRTRVVETYYLGPTEDSATLQLTGLENQHSGYSLTDFRRLLEKVYSDVKRGESHKLAESVQGALIHALQEVNPTLKNQSAKTAPFVVLVGANMPAILTEVACLSNQEDVQLLANSEYRQKIAQALFAGVRAYSTALYHANATRKDVAS